MSEYVMNKEMQKLELHFDKEDRVLYETNRGGKVNCRKYKTHK